MDIHEYQAKELLAGFGVAIPRGGVAYSPEQAVNGKGLCPANVSTRLARARLRIPAGVAWSFASGFEPAFAREGRR